VGVHDRDDRGDDRSCDGRDHRSEGAGGAVAHGGQGAGREPGRPGGLLHQLTRNVLDTVLEEELVEQLGHEHGQTPTSANMCNGTRSKTVLSKICPVEIEVPRTPPGPSGAGSSARSRFPARGAGERGPEALGYKTFQRVRSRLTCTGPRFRRNPGSVMAEFFL
jgi:hypothetical protein